MHKSIEHVVQKETYENVTRDSVYIKEPGGLFISMILIIFQSSFLVERSGFLRLTNCKESLGLCKFVT